MNYAPPDPVEVRRLVNAIKRGVPYMTTTPGAIAAAQALALHELRAALATIARHPLVERNSDGEDQAAHTMRLIAREALGASKGAA